MASLTLLQKGHASVDKIKYAAFNILKFHSHDQLVERSKKTQHGKLRAPKCKNSLVTPVDSKAAPHNIAEFLKRVLSNNRAYRIRKALDAMEGLRW